MLNLKMIYAFSSYIDPVRLVGIGWDVPDF
jgi:hypothetical protein